MFQLARISAHLPLLLLAGFKVCESGLLSLINSQSSGKLKLYMEAEAERVRITISQLLVVLFFGRSVSRGILLLPLTIMIYLSSNYN